MIMIKMTLEIDGMMCSMCESHVNDAIRGACKVKKVSSSHKSGRTEIIAESIDEGAVRGAVEGCGYKILSCFSEPYEKKGFFSSLFKKG